MTDPGEEPPQVARNALRVLQGRIAQHFDAAVARSPDQIRCAPGCEQCCHVRLSVFAVEAEAIEHALRSLAESSPELRTVVRQQADDPRSAGHCPMLVGGRCAIYDARPIICRSHGLPVLVEEPQRSPRRECCPLNFDGVDPPPASVLRLEAVNQPLSIMARMFDPRAQRIALADLARG